MVQSKATKTKKTTAASPSISRVASLFEEAQLSAANHRKNAHAMKKIQLASPTEEFNNEFIRMINKVLSVKKREPTVERTIAFVVACTQLLQEQDTEDEAGQNFTEFLLGYLLQGVESKDKAVRFRVTQLISLIMANMQEVGNDIWEAIKTKLVERSYDKESNVRVQAVYALAKLQGSEEVDEDQQDPIVVRLQEMLRFDPSAEVRRAAVANVELSVHTLPFIVERVMDTDAILRRFIFKKTLAGVDFEMLTIEDRERILNSGLQDSDRQVREACLQLMCDHWIKSCNDNMIEFLGRLDVIDKTNVAEHVLMAFFQAYTAFEFPTDDSVWENLTAESTLFLRVYCEYCSSKQLSAKLEQTLPEISRLCTYIQKVYQQLTEADGDDIITYEFVLLQLLVIAKIADFADEVGRRRMLTLLREFLLQPFNSDAMLPALMDIVQIIAANERDFIRIVVEVIADRRDPTENSDRPFKSSDLDERLQQLMVTKERALLQGEDDQLEDILKAINEIQDEIGNKSNSQLDVTIMPRKDDTSTCFVCLRLAKAMLQRIHLNLRENAALVTMVGELILPALVSRDVNVQLLGVNCLGLCAILDLNLAKQQMSFFVACVKQAGSEDLQMDALKILFDLIMTHGVTALEEPNIVILREFLQSESASIQKLAAEGFCKLFLLNSVSDTVALTSLVVLYFDPSTTNTSLHECLAYALHEFAYADYAHQRLFIQVFIPVLETMASIMIKQENISEQALSLTQMAQTLVDWTDSAKLVTAPTSNVVHAHMELAQTILLHVINDAPEISKVLCGVMAKLTMDKKAPQTTYKRLSLLSRLLLQKLKDKTSINSVVKFRTQIDKFDEDPQSSLAADEIESLLLLLPGMTTNDLLNQESQDENEAPTAQRSTRTRRATKASSSENVTKSKSAAKKRGQKAAVIETSEEEDDEEEQQPTVTEEPVDEESEYDD